MSDQRKDFLSEEGMTKDDKEKALRLSGDILSFVVGFGLLTGASWWAGLYEWAGFWVTLAVALGVWEYVSVRKDGKTLSEKLALTMRTRPALGWSIWGLIAAAFALLLYHFVALAR